MRAACRAAPGSRVHVHGRAGRLTVVVPSARTSPRPLPSDGAPAPAAAAGGTVPGARRGTARRDRSAAWLGTAAAGLGLLAGAAAVVSFSAQYEMVLAARGLPAVAALEAAIPDAAAVIFASLGIALALHGRRAVRSRLLNVAAVATSVAMNALAAAPGWRDLAIWAMPPVAYALASDTLIGVVRATVIARHKAVRAVADDGDATPLAVLGGVARWLLRLALAPASTLRGLRGWVIDECPVAPGRRAPRPAPARAAAVAQGNAAPPPALPAAGQARPRGARAGTKTARFLALVAERHGPLAGIPLASVSGICADIAPLAGLNAGAARTALRRAVLAAREGSPR